MNLANRIKVFLLFVGDIIALYAGLFIALLIRYGGGFYEQFVSVHAAPFTIVFVPWIIIFYVSGLYDLRRLRNNLDFLKTLGLSLLVNAALAVILFYLVPAFGIAPKTNLLIFIAVFAVIEILWRRMFNRVAAFGEAPNKVLVVGGGATKTEVVETIRGNRQLGYEICAEIEESAAARSPVVLKDAVEREHANLIVIPRTLKNEPALAKTLYELFGRGILVLDLANFYELVMQKVPLADLEEAWFLENISHGPRFYDQMKRASEFIGALLLGLVLIPVELVIALIIKLTSRGPVFIRQARVGKLGNLFTLYKFRSMVALAPDGQAETGGAQWSGKNDKRVTPFGKLLRASHLDELPQLWNIVRGDISFVGPRPERPEFVEVLKEKVPYYEVRLLIKPGVTGWAQINHHKDTTTEDVKQKLQYDIYYLKNRSVVLDWAIIIKTAKSIFVNPE